MSKIQIKLTALGTGMGSFLTPFIAFAATTPKTFAELVGFIVGYINLLIPITITLAVLYYMWHTADGLRKMKDGKVAPDWQTTMIWGIIVIFLMVSIWGILNILAATFQIPVNR